MGIQITDTILVMDRAVYFATALLSVYNLLRVLRIKHRDLKTRVLLGVMSLTTPVYFTLAMANALGVVFPAAATSLGWSTYNALTLSLNSMFIGYLERNQDVDA